jgi:hypothetical protein
MQIKQGTKTQTRRVAKPNSFIYQIGKTYGIRPCRTCKNIPDGRILILSQKLELWQDKITGQDAWAEGGYYPRDYEGLFESMHPKWRSRYAYTFKFLANQKEVSGGSATVSEEMQGGRDVSSLSKNTAPQDSREPSPNPMTPSTQEEQKGASPKAENNQKPSVVAPGEPSISELKDFYKKWGETNKQ